MSAVVGSASVGLADATYVGSATDTNWNTAANWTPAVPAEGENVVIANTTAQNTLTLNDAVHAVGTFTLGDTGTRATAFTVNGANALTFNAGVNASSNSTTTVATFLTVATPVVVQGDQTWTIGGGPGGASNDTGMTLSSGSNVLTLNGKLTKAGSGQLFIVGRNVGDGSIDVNAGSVKLNAGSSAALSVGGTGTITVNTGASLIISKNSGTLTMSKAVAINTGGALSFGGNSTANPVNVTSPIAWTGTTTFNLTSDTANVVGTFSGNFTGSGTITVTTGGSGANRSLVLNGNNSGLSAQISNNTQLAIGTDTALGTGTYRANVAGAILRSATTDARTVANTFDVANNATLGSATTGNLTFTGSVALGNSPKTLTIANAKTTMSGVVSSGTAPTGALTTAGTGILEFSGANTYTRATTVSAGTLLLTGAGRLGSLAADNNYTITVLDAGLLDVQTTSNAINNLAPVAITSTDATPEVNLAAGVNDTVLSLTINGIAMEAGTYGSSTSGAANIGLANPDDIFSGAGRLTVTVPEPSTLGAAGAVAAGLLARRRRRRA